MNVHLFATDASAVALADDLPQSAKINALIVPGNRETSPKVKALLAATRWPVYVHRRGEPLSDTLPPADAGVSWLYSQILTVADLARYSRGILNMHGGKIPEYRGANVLQWAIVNGEVELGVTWHEMSPEVDAGLIWHETTIPIATDATGWDVRQAMVAKGIETFPVAWQRFCERPSDGRTPDPRAGRRWPARRPEDSRIPSGLTAAALHNLVRAQRGPWPAAFLAIDDRRIPIARVESQPQSGRIPYRCADGSVVHLVPASFE